MDMTKFCDLAFARYRLRMGDKTAGIFMADTSAVQAIIELAQRTQYSR